MQTLTIRRNKSFHVFPFCFGMTILHVFRRRKGLGIPVDKHIISSQCTILSGTDTKYIYDVQHKYSFVFSPALRFTWSLLATVSHKRADGGSITNDGPLFLLVCVFVRAGGWIYLFSILFRFALNQCVYQFDPKLHITWMSPLKIGVFMDSLMFIRNRQFEFAFCVLFTCFFVHYTSLHFITVTISLSRLFLPPVVVVWKIECFLCAVCVCAIMVFRRWTLGNLRYVLHQLRWCKIRIFCRFAIHHESV